MTGLNRMRVLTVSREDGEARGGPDLQTRQKRERRAVQTTLSGEVIDTVGDEWQVESEFLAAIRAGNRGERWQVRPDFVPAARYMRKMQAIHDSVRDARLVRLQDDD